MSTLAVSNIQSQSSGTLPSFQDSGGIERGRLCRAFVNFNGTTSPGTIRSSFNVSSVTKNGTADYTVNFTNVLPDNDYIVAGGCGNDGQTDDRIISSSFYGSAPTNSSHRLRTTNNAGVSLDVNRITVVYFR